MRNTVWRLFQKNLKESISAYSSILKDTTWQHVGILMDIIIKDFFPEGRYYCLRVYLRDT